MSATVSLSQTQIFTALVSVLKMFGLRSALDGQTVEIVRGQVNRVPEPSGQDFVVIWPIMRDRLAMNIDTALDTIIVGSIAANILTVTDVTDGPVAAGQTLYNIAGTITAGCQITRQLRGTTGGNGTYSVTPTAPVASGTIYCGTIANMQETEVTVQCDVHGPAGADNAARIHTLFRDQFAVDAFDAQGFTLTPLYTSDPRQLAFDNGEQQVEERWVIDLCMQADVTITTTMQFMDTVTVTATPVESLA